LESEKDGDVEGFVGSGTWSIEEATSGEGKEEKELREYIEREKTGCKVLTNERILQSVGDAWVALTGSGKQRKQQIGAQTPETFLKLTL